NKHAFSGPRLFIRAAELDMHPLDARADRKEFAKAEQGLGYCNITKCCTEVCPEHIKITDNAIIPMKERVVDNRYDQLVWLGPQIPPRHPGGAQPAPRPGRAGGGPGSGPMEPAVTPGVTGVAAGMPFGSARIPEGPDLGPDGKLDVAELL